MPQLPKCFLIIFYLLIPVEGISIRKFHPPTYFSFNNSATAWLWIRTYNSHHKNMQVDRLTTLKLPLRCISAFLGLGIDPGTAATLTRIKCFNEWMTHLGKCVSLDLFVGANWTSSWKLCNTLFEGCLHLRVLWVSLWW